MDTSSSQYVRRAGPLSTYTAYSIACFVVWAIVWGIYLLGIARTAALGYILAVFLGWLAGWTSATIARAVYPPPKMRGVLSRSSTPPV